MFKKSIQIASILAALLSMHSVASATNCNVNPAPGCSPTANPTFNSDYNLDPAHNGIHLQNNFGSNTATVNLKNIVMRDNGDITATATAIGNIANFELSNTGSVPVKHVSQSNFGNNTATVSVLQNSASKTGEVTLEAVAIGNSFSLTADKISLSELSVAQCNIGNNTATAEFMWDPTKLTASATAIGNSISVRQPRAVAP